MPDEIGGGSLNLITTDAGDLYDETIRAISEAVGEPIYPGDERRMFAEAMLAVLVPVYNSVEDAARQTTLRYARGQVLDALGERLGVTRLGGTFATCMLKFTLSGERRRPVTIPKWTKATVDSEIYFATDRDAVIEVGELEVEVPATCMSTGEIGNGYLPGAVATLVDKIPYVASVENTTETAGGSDGEGYNTEGDARFRERIRLAPEKLSTAGPELSYIYYAKSADASITDVAAISETEYFDRELPVADGKVYMGGDLLVPDHMTINGEDTGYTYEYKDSLLTITLDEPLKSEHTVKVRIMHKMDGRVRIVVLTKSGYADDDLLQRVYDTVNAKDVRPMTDVVTVEAASPVEYDINLDYWVTPETEAAMVDMVEGEDGAIRRWINEQQSRLGRDINPDVLISYMMHPTWTDSGEGVIRVEITEPEYTPVDDGQVPRFSGRLTAKHHLETLARWD